jgi:hypothetical protein
MNDDEYDEADMIPQHDAVTELDEWREEERKRIIETAGGQHIVGGQSDMDDQVNSAVAAAHSREIEEKIEELKTEKAELAARMELDEMPSQEDFDQMEALDSAISELEYVIGA